MAGHEKTEKNEQNEQGEKGDAAADGLAAALFHAASRRKKGLRWAVPLGLAVFAAC